MKSESKSSLRPLGGSREKIDHMLSILCALVLIIATPQLLAQNLLQLPNLPLTKMDNGQVTRISAAPDGSVLVIGRFVAINGQARSGIARFDQTGVLDPSFTPSVWGAEHVAAAPNGSIYISGPLTDSNGQPVRSPSRLKPDGSLSSNFIASVDSRGPIAFDTTGRIYVGTRRYLPNGTEDSNWSLNLGGSTPFLSKILISGNQLYVVGGFASINGVARTSVARLSIDGTVDPGFNVTLGGTDPVAIDIELIGNDVFLAGNFQSISGNPNRFVAKIDTNGVVNPSWDAGVNQLVLDVEVEGSNVYLGGQFTVAGGTQRYRVAQVNRTSAAVSSFNPSMDDTVLALKVTPSKLWVGGGFDRARYLLNGTTNRFALAQIDKDTGLPFASVSHAQGSGEVLHILPLTDGGFLVAGTFELGNPERANLLKLNADFSIDLTFSATTNGTVFDASQDANGDIIVGGNFTSVNDQARRRLARIKSLDGSLTGWCAGSGLGANNTVDRVGANPAGTFVGGIFTNISGFPNSEYGARVSSSCTPAQFPGFTTSAARIAGMADDGFFTYQGTFAQIAKRSLQTGANLWTQSIIASGPYPRFNRIIVDSGDNAYLIGQFTHVNNQPRLGLSLINHRNGSIATFAPITSAPTTFSLFEVALDNQYLYFATTSMIEIGGAQRTGLMRVSKDTGNLDSTFSLPVSGNVLGSAVSNQRLLLGGSFDRLGTAVRSGLGAVALPNWQVDVIFRSSFE